MGAHQGVNRTFKRLRQYYKFPKMLTLVKKMIKNCILCQKNKFGRKNVVPMKLTTTSSKPFEKNFLDIVGPINPPKHTDSKYILTMQDDLSTFLVAVPIPDQESTTIAKAFVLNFICFVWCTTNYSHRSSC